MKREGSEDISLSPSVHQAADERTFHVFYQIMNWMPTKERAEYLFQDPKTYHHLRNGNLHVPRINNAQEYLDTVEAMKIMGLSEEEQVGIF